MPADKFIDKTKEAFSFAWNTFGKHEIEENWVKDSYQYYKWFKPYTDKGLKRVLDAGCGSGADILKWAPNCEMIFGMDLSEAVFVARKNTEKQSNARFSRGSIYEPPFRNGAFDLIYSFGVLHHMDDTAGALRKLTELLEKEGVMILYLYENLKEKSIIKHLALKFVNFFRSLIRLFPVKIIYFICRIMAVCVLVLLSWPAAVLSKLGMKKLAGLLPYFHTTNYRTIVSDLFDRFSPPIEKRYTKNEALELIKSAGLEPVSIHNYRGWVVIGRKLNG